ncbi:hypothetical protein [Oceanobacillus timonensis]|uniref:hypothetical protein n=1 Tax=Oceanobacillus timonensis TaxID=1926285 RepID=UPI0009BB6EE3|nr:hypothetical protein [Oceanobacillus timonensis]
MLNRHLMIAMMIIILPITQLSSGIHHSYLLTEQEMLVDTQMSQDLGLGGNDQSDKSFITYPALVIALFLLGTFSLFTMIVSINRTKRLMTPVFYQSNFVV